MIRRMAAPRAPLRASSLLLALGAAAYLGGVLAFSLHPGPRAWGLHSLGFLPSVPKAAILILGGAGVVLLLLDAMSRGKIGTSQPSGVPPFAGTAAGEGKPRPRPGRSNVILPGILIALPAIFWFLRARTQFLGDGTVWLSGLQTGAITAKNEPLSAALWLGFAGLLRANHHPVSADTVSIMSILCGVVACATAWALSRELVPGAGGRGVALVLILTLGVTQLYFGYIESYAPTAMFVLIYLWLGLRRMR